MADSRYLPVPDGIAGERVDAGLARLLGLSRSAAAQIAESGGVRMDGRVLGKSDRLAAGAMLDVEMPAPPSADSDRDHEPVPGMRIVYDDADLVVVDKPVGVAAHASVGWTGPTVVGGLAAAGYRISTSGPPERKGIVHRLDVGTSGLMAVAKSEQAYSVLKRAFRNRTVHKLYHAVVQGHLDPLVGTIDAPIGRHPGRDFRFAVTADGKPSITHYEVIEMLPSASLVEVHLETGRTHQIRVHMAALNHPCVGDPQYGANPKIAAALGLERQWLHAVKLGFEHPTSGQWIEFSSNYPPDLVHALDVLRDRYR